MSDRGSNGRPTHRGEKRGYPYVPGNERPSSSRSSIDSISKRLCDRERTFPNLSMDQPADLSMKRERRDPNELGGSSSSGSSRSAQSHGLPRYARDWWSPAAGMGSQPVGHRGGEPSPHAEGMVLDLANRGQRRPSPQVPSQQQQGSGSRHRGPDAPPRRERGHDRDRALERAHSHDRDRSLERAHDRDRSLERAHERERNLERTHDRDRSLERAHDRDRSLERVHDRDRSLERAHDHRSLERALDRSLERAHDRDRSLERAHDRDRSLERAHERESVLERAHAHVRDRSLERAHREQDLMRERARTNESDVIVLSDEDGPRLNGHVNGHAGSARRPAHWDGEEDGGERRPAMPDLAELLKELSPDDLKRREQLIGKLKENLRSEEMKLVLLKKLQLSHQLKENLAVSSAPQQSQSGSNKSSQSVGGSSGGGRMGGSGTHPQALPPPPLVRGSPSAQSKSLQNQVQQMMVPPLVRPPQNQHGSSHLLLTQSRSSSSSSSGQSPLNSNALLQQGLMRAPNQSRTPTTTTSQNVIMGYPVQSSSQRSSNNESYGSRSNKASHLAYPQMQLSSGSAPSPSPSPLQQQQQQQQSSAPPQAPSPQQQQQQQADRAADNQTPAQRQAAAKLALRKQLEKTLLQIPPPKPPPPEMHFIPNPSNTEFIYLVGLEAVVNCIKENEAGSGPVATPAGPRPFHCVQCVTDFTPVWKWEQSTKKKGGGSVICEQCVTTNIKKALKAEHTNRLKTAFVKALQQEQEIEQRMAQVSNSPPVPAPAPSPAPTHQQQTSSGSGGGNSSSSPSLLQLPKLSEPSLRSHQSSSSSSSHHSTSASHHAAAAAAANLTAAHQQLLRLPQHGHQPLPAHMLAPLNPFLAQAYQFQMLGGKGGPSLGSSAAELQRQYLLDMIPPRSLPQGTHNWKT